MQDVVVELANQQVCKYSTNPAGYNRLSRELSVLKSLQGSNHIPIVTNFLNKNGKIVIYMDEVKGQNGKQLIGMKDGYSTQPIPWKQAKKWLQQYVEAEMDFLTRNSLYRDMNLDHLIFTGDKIVFLDFESTVINSGEATWQFRNLRGTWETMAPEEFPGYGQLSARTVTYRAAIISHILLTGTLPFKIFPVSRSATYKWRKQHVAEVSPRLSDQTRHVFMSALARKEAHRYKNPESFFKALVASYEINKVK